MSLTPESSPELTKRSWFGTLMGSERDETYTILVKGKPLASVKADLIHAFLSVSLCNTEQRSRLLPQQLRVRSLILCLLLPAWPDCRSESQRRQSDVVQSGIPTR